MKAEKMVTLAKNKAKTPRPQKKQKLDRASRDDVQPRKNATPLVNEVMEIEAPAWIIPILNLSSMGALGSVWSRADEITNMSSTPIPISMNGSKLWIPADLPPTM